MNFKDTFLNLTQWVIPHGMEETITHLLPEGCQKDIKGNYSITIGKSETLFTCHLDTVSTRAKVNHVIDGDWIKTDGTTILGGDNKAGVCVLMYLIEQKVPGTYYFFVGEECGRLGSKWALENNLDYFKQFKRAVAFDRRNRGSIITHQSSRLCCSPEFVTSLSKELSSLGLEYNGDSGGSYTDTYTFIDCIQECTNLSAGVVDEHTKSEKVDIVYLEQVAKAAAKIDWEKLPSQRDISKKEYKTYFSSNNSNYNTEYDDYDYWHGYSATKTSKGLYSIGINGEDIYFSINNVSKYFNLTKVIDDEISYYTSNDKRKFYFTIEPNEISVEEEFDKFPYFNQFFYASNKNGKSLPKSFDELWDAIKNKVMVSSEKTSFRPWKEIENKKQVNVPYYRSYIEKYYSLSEFETDSGKIYEDTNSLRQFQFDMDINNIAIYELFDNEPYINTLYKGKNNYSSFDQQWNEIKYYVPFTKRGEHYNNFYNASISKQYGIISTNESVVKKPIPFINENIINYFNLEQVKEEECPQNFPMVSKCFFKNPINSKIYFIDINNKGIVYIWIVGCKFSLIESGNNKYTSFDELWKIISDQVDFCKKEQYKLQVNIPFKEENITNYFKLVKRDSTVVYYSSYDNQNGFYIKISDEGTVYLSDILIEEEPKTIISYKKFNSFDELYIAIKDKVTIERKCDELTKKVVRYLPAVIVKENNNIIFTFDNSNISEYFNLKPDKNKHRRYIDDINNIEYFFEIDNENGVYLWERGKKVRTILDGDKFNNFEDLWDVIKNNVSFKKKSDYIEFTQDNVTRYFDVVATMMQYFYVDRKTETSYYILCGKNKPRNAVRIVEYVENGKKINSMKTITMKDRLGSFEELWECIKDCGIRRR